MKNLTHKYKILNEMFSAIIKFSSTIFNEVNVVTCPRLANYEKHFKKFISDSKST